MSNVEKKPPIIYRYLGSHWYETLRDAEFLASSPDKFNDLLDCTAATKGHVPDSEVDKYLTEHDWIRVFSEIALEKGLPIVDFTLNVLNSDYINRDNLRIDERLTRALKDRATLSKVWRIVCFSESPTDVVERWKTERRMWKRYADKDRGVRIGFDFSLCTRDTKSGILGRIKYSETEAVINLDNALVEPNIILNYPSVVLTKRNVWANEHEIRLVTTPTFCSVRRNASGNEQCFWQFNREIVREVCIGMRFPKNQLKGLVKMVRRNYPTDVRILQAERPTPVDGYEYKEI